MTKVGRKDGGREEVGFKRGMRGGFNDYGGGINEVKEKDKKLEGKDMGEGLRGIISVGMGEELLEFEGERKCKVGRGEGRGGVERVVGEKLG